MSGCPASPPRPDISVLTTTGLFNTRWTEYPLIIDCRSNEDYQAGHPGHALHLGIDLTAAGASVTKLQLRERLAALVATATRSWAPNDRCRSVTLCLPVSTNGAQIAISALESGSEEASLVTTVLAAASTTASLPFQSIRIACSEAVDGFRTAFPFLVNLAPQSLPSLPFRIDLPLLSGGLYLGNADCARESFNFTALRVSRVVNCTTETRNFYESPTSRSVDFPADVTYLRLSLKDSNTQSLQAAVDAACPFISEALEGGLSVLVHCQQGLSRSVAIVLAYLMRGHGMRLWEAESRLSTYVLHGAKPQPNSGFSRQLLDMDSGVSQEPAIARTHSRLQSFESSGY